jgi:hypothetical protein
MDPSAAQRFARDAVTVWQGLGMTSAGAMVGSDNP